MKNLHMFACWNLGFKMLYNLSLQNAPSNRDYYLDVVVNSCPNFSTKPSTYFFNSEFKTLLDFSQWKIFYGVKKVWIKSFSVPLFLSILYKYEILRVIFANYRQRHQSVKIPNKRVKSLWRLPVKHGIYPEYWETKRKIFDFVPV